MTQCEIGSMCPHYDWISGCALAICPDECRICGLRQDDICREEQKDKESKK